MLHVGLDLSRTRLDYQALAEDGLAVDAGAAPPDADGLDGLAERLSHHGEPVRAAIESMNGARFVHDRLELAGWEVEIADALKVKGLAPLACKTDRIDAWVLAELSRRDLVPAIWLPDPEVRAERERARWRLHLVRHRSRLKHRVHSTLLAWGRPRPVSDLFGARGRELLERFEIPEPWRPNLELAVSMIDSLDREIAACERELRRMGADHRYVPLLTTIPGSPGFWATRSPPRSARSAASPRRASSPATPAFVRASTGRASATAAARSRSRDPNTCAGR
jgi:transposase